MIPDHTALLRPYEAYVAVGDSTIQYEVESNSHILAMRLPSYFKGDLRKLQCISRVELRKRCLRRSIFFDGIKVGLVLSTIGLMSEAEKMSGGDFDGDRAWVCWEEEIVNHVSFFPPVDTTQEEFKLPESPDRHQLVEWKEPVWSKAIIKYSHHHQQDSICLGKLW